MEREDAYPYKIKDRKKLRKIVERAVERQHMSKEAVIENILAFYELKLKEKADPESLNLNFDELPASIFPLEIIIPRGALENCLERKKYKYKITWECYSQCGVDSFDWEKRYFESNNLKEAKRRYRRLLKASKEEDPDFINVKFKEVK